ncbi:hypothetical protein SEUCBS140593_002415 [Sporothrix eucalyptigena]|uniref:PLC-like phosphodiesterase n=1 Tax=Sporothrix eucalyptigena TaxID=1812306 RepID=A0ABP0B6D3_9PEZI
MTILLVGVTALAGSVSAVPSRLDRRDQSCNGSPSLCSRLYSDVTYVGSHDSAFVGLLPTDNQFTSVASQLSEGVRFLQAQSHNKNGVIELCHTTCLEKDAGSLASYLVPIKSFLDANPNEVITLLLTNGDAIPVSQYGTVFQAAGLDTYAYAPSGTLSLDQWPTLAEMIATGKRLVVFMDYNADTSQVNYILDEFTYLYETPYDTTDPNFAECTLDRPAGASASGRMGLVNHFLDVELDLFGEVILIPDTIKAATTNSISSITAQTNLCVNAFGRQPNFVLLDFISIGQAMAAQNQLNGL